MLNRVIIVLTTMRSDWTGRCDLNIERLALASVRIHSVRFYLFLLSLTKSMFQPVFGYKKADLLGEGKARCKRGGDNEILSVNKLITFQLHFVAYLVSGWLFLSNGFNTAIRVT
jgi:hypothetical protein